MEVLALARPAQLYRDVLKIIARHAGLCSSLRQCLRTEA
jgi:hypothetical protein